MKCMQCRVLWRGAGPKLHLRWADESLESAYMAQPLSIHCESLTKSEVAPTAGGQRHAATVSPLGSNLRSMLATGEAAASGSCAWLCRASSCTALAAQSAPCHAACGGGGRRSVTPPVKPRTVVMLLEGG